MGRKTLTTTILLIGTCISLFAQHSDCSTARRICTLDKYTFTPSGTGSQKENLSQLKDNQNHFETNSIWLFWDVEKNGDFIFELEPEDLSDDLDFTVFKANSEGCHSLKQVRSVFSGVNLPYLERSDPCMGATGLSYSASDFVESSGCLKGQDNFVKYVTAHTSERYYILINNFASRRGFEFKLSGTLTIDDKDCQGEGQHLEIDNLLTVFPNPVSDDIYITVSSSSKLIDISIMDMVGRRLMNLETDLYKDKSSHKTNTKHLQGGTYIVRVETEGGVMEKRFVKI